LANFIAKVSIEDDWVIGSNHRRTDLPLHEWNRKGEEFFEEETPVESNLENLKFD
jgi:hypothetical protein